jgi:MFS family permease
MPDGEKRSSPFSSLRVRNYRLLLSGQTVSQAGTWVDTTAQAWLVLLLTNSGTALGLATAARFMPIIVLGPWGGVIADRVNKRRLLLVTQGVLCVVAILLWVFVVTGAITMPAVYVLSLCTGVANAFDSPARQTIIIEMVGTDLARNAISLNSVIVNIARIVGPSIAAVLIRFVGLSLCFAVNAASFVVVLAMLATVRERDMHLSTRADRGPGQLRAGIRYLASERALLAPFLLVTVTGVFAWEYPVTLPLMAKAGLSAGPDALAAMFGSMGVGAVIGGLASGSFRRTRMRGLVAAGLAWGAFMLVAAGGPTLVVICAALFVAGYASVVFNTVAKTLLQLRAVPVMRGRVMALWATAWNGSTAVGGPIVGWIGQTFGARWSLTAGGLPTLAASAVLGYLLLVDRRPGADRTGPATDDTEPVSQPTAPLAQNGETLP